MTTAAVRAALARESGEAFLVLMTLSNPGLANPIRVCTDARPVVSNGATYQPYPFECNFPQEKGESPASATLKIDNVDLQITQAARSIVGSTMSVDIFAVLSTTPDTVEAGPAHFTLRDVTYTDSSVEGKLVFEDLLNEPFPSDEFGPGTTPGIFAA